MKNKNIDSGPENTLWGQSLMFIKIFILYGNRGISAVLGNIFKCNGYSVLVFKNIVNCLSCPVQNDGWQPFHSSDFIRSWQVFGVPGKKYANAYDTCDGLKKGYGDSQSQIMKPLFLPPEVSAKCPVPIILLHTPIVRNTRILDKSGCVKTKYLIEYTSRTYEYVQPNILH